MPESLPSFDERERFRQAVIDIEALIAESQALIVLSRALTDTIAATEAAALPASPDLLSKRPDGRRCSSWLHLRSTFPACA